MRTKITKDSTEKPEKVGNYFTEQKSLEFISSGCTLLDCILGGGWAIGRISNVVGDNSSGKTLQAIEASANFLRQYPDGKVWYHETEAAFDSEYAEALGMPVNKITMVREECEDADVVEGLFNYLKDVVLPFFKKNPETRGLYILDTQDAIGCKTENARGIEEGSYNQSKNIVLNRLYRELTSEIEKSNLHLMIISQTRDNIGVTFGRKWRVSGEGALKFYASQRIQFAEVKKLKRTIKGVERPYGIDVKANCFKNKVGLPYRTCGFPIVFGYGINDLASSLEWLKEVKMLDELGISEKEITKLSEKHVHEPDMELANRINTYVKKCWQEIETSFIPKAKKY